MFTLAIHFFFSFTVGEYMKDKKLTDDCFYTVVRPDAYRITIKKEFFKCFAKVLSIAVVSPLP